jgi:hypothetical protein
MLSHWNDWREDAAPHVLAQDEPVLRGHKKRSVVLTWQEAYRLPEFGRPGDRRLHLGLLPQPFCGDVENASIYVLMLNPGIGWQDYYGEYNVPEYREALLKALRQDFAADDIPFHFLDPQFSWHGGFGWWHGKLVRLIEQLAKNWETPFAEARARLGRQLASIELVPYHSEGFSNAGGLAKKLPSAKLAVEFVNEVVLPKVRDGRAIVTVARKAKVWGLKEESGVIGYDRGEARGAHLGPKSRGGRAILQHLIPQNLLLPSR